MPHETMLQKKIVGCLFEVVSLVVMCSCFTMLMPAAPKSGRTALLGGSTSDILVGTQRHLNT